MTSYHRRKSHFYKLANEDMPLFVSVLLGLPEPMTFPAIRLRKDIKALPHYLRASGFHKSPSKSTGKVQPGYLCDLHKHLKKGLCYETMALMKHEIRKIGDFIYPVIMSGELEPLDEGKARQLEPVHQMYVPGFDVRHSTPDGLQPILPGETDGKGVFVPLWYYETNQCPACMLARIGRDRIVLFALLAGMIARISPIQTGLKEHPRSRRVRFVKGWLEAHEHGKVSVDKAWALGTRMRSIRMKLVAAEEARKQARAEKHRRRATVSEVPRSREESVIGFDISNSYAPPYQQASAPRAPSIRSSTDKASAIGVDISDSFVLGPSLANHVSVSESDSEGSTVISVDILEPFVPPPARERPPPQAPVKVPPRPRSLVLDSARLGSTYDTQSRYSIAPSFTSNMSLSNVRPPTRDVDLFSDTADRTSRVPTIPERRGRKLPAPPPRSIYVSYGQPEVHAAGQYEDVSPPGTPAGRDTHDQYDVSSLASPQRGRFDMYLPGSPKERPVTTWGELYQ